MNQIEEFKLITENLVGARAKLYSYTSGMQSLVILLEKDGRFFILGFKDIARLKARVEWIFENSEIEKIDEQGYKIYDQNQNYEIVCNSFSACKVSSPQVVESH